MLKTILTLGTSGFMLLLPSAGRTVLRPARLVQNQDKPVCRTVVPDDEAGAHRAKWRALHLHLRCHAAMWELTFRCDGAECVFHVAVNPQAMDAAEATGVMRMSKDKHGIKGEERKDVPILDAVTFSGHPVR